MSDPIQCRCDDPGSCRNCNPSSQRTYKLNPAMLVSQEYYEDGPACDIGESCQGCGADVSGGEYCLRCKMTARSVGMTAGQMLEFEESDAPVADDNLIRGVF